VTRPTVTKVTDGPVTTYHFGPIPDPDVEDCGCDRGTPVQQVPMIGTVCTGCGEAVDQ
jgi:hypothetical protein